MDKNTTKKKKKQKTIYKNSSGNHGVGLKKRVKTDEQQEI